MLDDMERRLMARINGAQERLLERIGDVETQLIMSIQTITRLADAITKLAGSVGQQADLISDVDMRVALLEGEHP